MLALSMGCSCTLAEAVPLFLRSLKTVIINHSIEETINKSQQHALGIEI